MKNILITGASSGIGRATAIRIAEENLGALILCGRRNDALSLLKEKLERITTLPVHILVFDIRQYEQVDAALQSLGERKDQIDILINNAGLAKGLDYIHEGKLSDWETMIDTNLKGLLYITRLITPGMVSRKSGHIVNVCSTAGKEVYPMGNVYCATKFAVDALTKSFRQDLYKYNIRIGQVAPGHVEQTEFALNRFDGDAERASIYKDFNPLTAKDVADAIYYMITRPPHVNIQDILLMGTHQAGSTLINRSGRHYDQD